VELSHRRKHARPRLTAQNAARERRRHVIKHIACALVDNERAIFEDSSLERASQFVVAGMQEGDLAAVPHDWDKDPGRH
jgi:hypothetical protein